MDKQIDLKPQKNSLYYSWRNKSKQKKHKLKVNTIVDDKQNIEEENDEHSQYPEFPSIYENELYENKNEWDTMSHEEVQNEWHEYEGWFLKQYLNETISESDHTEDPLESPISTADLPMSDD